MKNPQQWSKSSTQIYKSALALSNPFNCTCTYSLQFNLMAHIIILLPHKANWSQTYPQYNKISINHPLYCNKRFFALRQQQKVSFVLSLDHRRAQELLKSPWHSQKNANTASFCTWCDTTCTRPKAAQLLCKFFKHRRVTVRRSVCVN